MGFERVTLGRTGLSVTRLGVAASYGTDEGMVEEAVERGVNYLWWGALRTKKMARGIRAVARRGREDLVVVMHAVSRKPAAISKLVEDALGQLGLDYLDVLLLAGHKRAPDCGLPGAAHRDSPDRAGPAHSPPASRSRRACARSRVRRRPGPLSPCARRPGFPVPSSWCAALPTRGS